MALWVPHTTIPRGDITFSITSELESSDSSVRRDGVAHVFRANRFLTPAFFGPKNLANSFVSVSGSRRRTSSTAYSVPRRFLGFHSNFWVLLFCFGVQVGRAGKDWDFSLLWATSLSDLLEKGGACLSSRGLVLSSQQKKRVELRLNQGSRETGESFMPR